jgi:hypothetical protein
MNTVEVIDRLMQRVRRDVDRLVADESEACAALSPDRSPLHSNDNYLMGWADACATKSSAIRKRAADRKRQS